jgi:hypothetical protein
VAGVDGLDLALAVDQGPVAESAVGDRRALVQGDDGAAALYSGGGLAVVGRACGGNEELRQGMHVFDR